MSHPPTEFDSGIETLRVVPYYGKHARYFRMARAVSEESLYEGYHHGALLVKGGSILSASPNRGGLCSFGSRFYPYKKGSPTPHAEIGCILGVDRSVTTGATVYVCRVGKQGDFRLSKPCEMCVGTLRYVGVRRVVWSVDENHCAIGRL